MPLPQAIALRPLVWLPMPTTAETVDNEVEETESMETKIVQAGAEASWNRLIHVHAKLQGHPNHDLLTSHEMREDTFNPDVHTLAALLKISAKRKDMESGWLIHRHILQKDLLRSNAFLGNGLVDMYSKCGSLVNAKKVFDDLHVRDVVSWNTLISGYAQHGCGWEALLCLKQMQDDGIAPNTITYFSSLKACGSIRGVEQGEELHVEIVKKGLVEHNPFLGNALIHMYGKCGCLDKAKEAFDTLPMQDIVSWNALIGGYVEHGLFEEALEFFERMQLLGISPNVITFTCILRACASIRAIEKGKKLHSLILRKGILLGRHAVLSSMLIDMYFKFGLLAEAQKVFDNLLARDVVTWTALIAGYAQYGAGEKALFFLKKMQIEGLSPNAVTYTCGLKACSSIGDIDEGRKIHAEVLKRNLLKKDLRLGNAVVDMYVKCGLLSRAQAMFDSLPVRDVVSWNVMIMGYAESEGSQKALNFFEEMLAEGVSPDATTYACILKACGNMGAAKKGSEIHAEISRKGMLRNHVHLGSSLIAMYIKCGMLIKAQKVFDELVVRDLVTWTALLTGYAKEGHDEEALKCFKQMQLEGISPNSITFIYGLKACSHIGASEHGSEIHSEIMRQELLQRDPIIGTALVDMYAKCGLSKEAQDVFNKLPSQDIASWNSLISGYAQLGEFENVLHSIDKMIEEDEIPDSVTFVSLLISCSHAGLVGKIQTIFEVMNRDYNIAPTLEHHTCIIDVFGRAGQLYMAATLVENTAFHSNPALWLALLGACQKWSSVELGRYAFDQLMLLDATESAAYACTYNIYAHRNLLEDGK